jgi:DNA-directed RNA polymerase sigma subunit (sigma70/sigma32)
MEESRLSSTQKGDLPQASFSEDTLLTDLRGQLSAIMKIRVAANLLDEQDAHILSLRMGLEDGKCYTLNQVSHMLHISPEKIRQHQYLALKKNIKDLKFFKLLRNYAGLVKLPRGVTYYLLRFSDSSEKDSALLGRRPAP